MIVAGFELTSTTSIAFLAQRFAGLRAGVIELAGLADDDRAGADEQNLLDVGAFRHGAASAMLRHHVDESLEEVIGVVRTRATPRDDIARRKSGNRGARALRLCGRSDSDGVMRGSFERIGINGEAVILRRDLDLASGESRSPVDCRRGGRT